MDKKLLKLFEDANYDELEVELKKLYPQISCISWEDDHDGDVPLHVVFVKLPYMLPFSGSSYAHFATLTTDAYDTGLEEIMSEIKVIEKDDVFKNHSSIEFQNYWTDLEARGYDVDELEKTPGQEYNDTLWEVIKDIRQDEGLTTKYRVVDAKGKDCIYEGYNQDEAVKTLNSYNNCCGDWYLEEEEME